MGLDHWIYRVRKCQPEIVDQIKKLTEPQVNSYLAQSDNKQISLIPCEQSTEDLEGFADKVRLTCYETDETALRTAYAVPLAASYCGGRYGADIHEMHYRLGDKRFEITLTSDELRQFDVPVQRDFWLCEMRQIRQWRKAYDIQDAIYKRHAIQNCGFHNITDDDTLDAIEDIDEDLMIPRLRKGEAIFYHEWY